MDDEELEGFGGDDELSLPKATVNKLISEMLPDDIICTKETRDLLIECCVEFIHLISTEANEICEKESKKTIGADHVLSALRSLGFESYVEEVSKVHTEHKLEHQEKVRERKSSGMLTAGLTAEELQRQQDELFKAARQKYEATHQPD